jgi:hypothetical protein
MATIINPSDQTITQYAIQKGGANNILANSVATLNASDYYNNTAQPCFCAIVQASGPSNVTGNGTAYTVIFDTKSFDQSTSYNTSTGIFTAPVTGRYQFNISITMNNVLVANTLGEILLVTTLGTWKLSNANYGVMFEAFSGLQTLGLSASIIVPMTATNTAKVQLNVFGNATANIGLQNGANQGTYFSGVLLD